MRYLASVVLSLLLASCSIVSSTPVLNNVLASKGDTRPFETPLPVNTAHKKLAIGYSSTIGVKEDGTVWSWGSDTHGSLGNGKLSTEQLTPMPIEGMTDFIEVAGNGLHFLALRRDGTVWSWGDNQYGQLGYTTEKNFYATPKQVVGLNNIISIAAALGHSLALDKQGRVWSFGSNDNMQLGFSPKDNKAHVTPQIAFVNIDAIKVIARGGKSVLLTNKDGVYYWGANTFLQKYMDMTLPKKYEFPNTIVDVAIGQVIYILTSDGFVWAQSGSNYAGRLGQGDYQDYTAPVKVKNIGRIKSIASQLESGIALDEKGRIWQWGDAVRFRTVITWQHNIEPYPVKVATFSNAVNVQSSSANAVLLDDGKVYFWGINGGRRGTGKVQKHEWETAREWFTPEKSLWTWK